MRDGSDFCPFVLLRKMQLNFLAVCRFLSVNFSIPKRVIKQMSKQCSLCQERGKTWNGSDPACAFKNGVFDTQNWNCATMNALRDIAEHIGLYWRDDLSAASFGAVPFEGDKWVGYIVMTWYKNKGATGMAMLMFDDEQPKPLTLEMAEEAIEYWVRRGAKRVKGGIVWQPTTNAAGTPNIAFRKNWNV